MTIRREPTGKEVVNMQDSSVNTWRKQEWTTIERTAVRVSVRLIPQVDNLRPRKGTTVISNLRPPRNLLRPLKIRKRQDSSRPISQSSGDFNDGTRHKPDGPRTRVYLPGIVVPIEYFQMDHKGCRLCYMSNVVARTLRIVMRNWSFFWEDDAPVSSFRQRFSCFHLPFIQFTI